MALVTFTGYPCSGKTRRAEQLKAQIEAVISAPDYSGPACKILLLSDDVLNLPRSVYDDSRNEKPARAALFTAVQRALGKDVLVLVDGMNYIKGYRYQMFCAAKEAGVRVCTVRRLQGKLRAALTLEKVYVATPQDKCREWNAGRGEGQAYDDETLDNLLMRYEEPSSMVRWDSPLFTLPWDDEGCQGEEIWKAITEGQAQVANAGTAAAPKAPTDALQSLENTAASIISFIVSEQASSGGLGGIVPVPLQSKDVVRLRLPPRNVPLSELQRLKRQFVTVHRKAITQGAVEKGGVDWTEASVAKKFVAYLEEYLNA